MKKTILSILIAAVTVASSQAQLLYDHNLYSWTAGNIVGQNTWAAHSGAAAVPIQVTSNGAVTLVQGANSREDVNFNIGTLQSNTTYYFGMTHSLIASTTPTTTYFAHFLGSTSIFSARLFVASTGTNGQYTLGLSNAGSSPDAGLTWSTPLLNGTSYNLIIGYNTANGIASLWVDPTSISSTSISTAISTPPVLQAIALRQGSGNTTHTITDMAAGTNFDSVLQAIPEPSSSMLMVLGAGALVGIRSLRRKQS